MRLASAVLVLAGLLSVQAQAQDAEDKQARALFLAGEAYFDRGEYDLAFEQFTRAYALSPRSGLLLNAGLAAERAGYAKEALRYFERYLAQKPDAAERDLLEPRMRGLKDRIARGDQDQLVAEIEARPAPAPAPAPALPPKDDFPRLPAPTAVAWGVAGLAAVGALTFGLLAKSERRGLDDGCGASGSCTASDTASLQRFNRISDASLAITAGAALTGAVWWLVEGKRTRPRGFAFTGTGVRYRADF